jgi:serine protease
MKKNLLHLFLFLCTCTTFSQTVFEGCIDGRVYVKFDQVSLKPVAAEDPRNIPLSKFKAIEGLIGKYGITKAYKPFYQANDDKNLPYVIKLEFSKIWQVNSLIADLEKIQGVEYAEKVSLNKSQAVPNDPLFSTSGGSVHLNQINAQNAWNIFNGNSNITVAIVDNAVMWTHVDLVTNTYTNTAEIAANSIDDDGNGYIDDRNGWDAADNDNNPVHSSTSFFHGTHCAGIAGAATNNSTGVAGMGWNIKIIPVKGEPNSSTNTLLVTYGYEGIIYAVKAKARIISCSWGNNTFGPLITEQYVIDYAWNRGSLVICSAGNFSNSTPYHPGAYNHVYCVAAVDPTDVKASYSNFGTWVDICAPGSNIESTMPYTSSPAYGQNSGTSMAAPLVAGLAALMLSKSPQMTNTDVINCISTTAVNIYTLLGNSSYVSGSQLGAGRIDAYAAMQCAAGYSVVPPVANFYAFPPKTCPNTLINFYDSSLYVPTSWNWVFQGGSPATSTLTNPTVSWSAPGTYSVSLTVSNTNGSNTKTKLSYVTVAAPSPLPFFEGFENTPFLPTGWYANNIWNDNIYWTRRTGLGAYGTSTACAMFDNFILNVPGERDEMRSPTFNFSNVATARLRFDVAYAQYNSTFSDTLEVKLSTNCGATWTSIYLKGGSNLATAPNTAGQFIPSNTQWRRDSIDISVATAGQGAVLFGFINRGHYGQGIYLDNINLAFPTPTLNTTGTSSICVNTPHTFSNTSVSAASYTWNFPGGSPATSSATNPTVTYASSGIYTLTFMGVNGTSSATATRTVNVSSFPILSVLSNPTGSVCAGASVTLSATGATTYSLNGSPVGNTFVVNPMATTIYSVTGGSSGCNITDTVSVVVGPSNVTVAIAASSNSICAGNSVTLTATGSANTYSWSTSPTSSSIVITPTTTTSYAVTGFSGACQGTAVKTITVIPIPASSVVANNASCSNSCDGVATATTNGIGPFSYSLNPGTCTALPCNNLCAGSYTLFVSDAFGCKSMDFFSISAPAPINAAMNYTPATCASCPDGALLVNPSGGVAPFTYTWIPQGGNAALASGLTAQCYTISMTDANGCVYSDTACVTISNGIKESNISDVKIYPNPVHGSLTIEMSAAGFNYTVFNSLGQLILHAKAEQNKEEINLEEFAKGIYFVEVETPQIKIHRKILVE